MATPGSPVLLAAGVVAVAVHLWGLYRPSATVVPAPFPYVDKVEHLVGFALPVVLLSLWLRPDGQLRGGPLVVGAVFAGHAVVSEVLQATLLPGRSGDVADVGADLLGVAVGLLAYVGIARLVRRFRRARRAP